MNAVEIYTDSDGMTHLSVTFDQGTVWLNQRQMAELFGKDVRTVSEHIGNAFEERELMPNATIRKFRIVQKEGRREVTREIEHYNLDVIISVGYRIKSPQGTRFRQWATVRLRDHLVQGYTLNEERLNAQQENIRQLEHTLALFQQNLIDSTDLSEARGLVRVIADYARTFILLNQFDNERLPLTDFTVNIRYEIQYSQAVEAIALLKQNLRDKGEASDLFGNQKDDSFAGILGNIVQSFGGEYLYPSVEAQAAHLLYFGIKNHPFSDGNKRIGAFLFIWFLERNRHHLKVSGELKINDNALAAIALLVAQSDPAQKDLMIHLIMNLIRG